MADDNQIDETVGDEVQWHRDPDGTEWFVDDGVRFELADDGFAYPVVGGSTDPAGAEVLDVLPPEDDAADWPDTSSTAAVDASDVDDTADTDADAATADADAAGEEASPFAPRDQTTRIVTVKVDGDEDEDEEAADDSAAASATTTAEVPRVEVAEPDPETETRDTSGVEPLLKLHGLDAGYGSLPVLQGVEMQIRPGETAVLLGLNGAGKTTTAWTVTGALTPWGGTISYDGEDVTGWTTAKAVQNGVVMVPEGRRAFADLSVGRNLQVGAWGKRGDGDWVDHQREVVFDYFPRLREREKQLAGTLSGGEQQMLAVGRGLMADPRLLIIDEASMGLAPVIVKDVFDIIAQINEDGVTVMLIEQNVGALEVADVGYVMEQGRMVRVLEGEELRDRSVVSEALMG